jgi:hypothetical protein
MLPNKYCLHFVADLRRAVHCLVNNNLEGAKVFLDHAEKIYKENILNTQKEQLVFADTEALWKTLYKETIPEDIEYQKKHADKLLTFSSIIFSRAMNTHAVR